MLDYTSAPEVPVPRDRYSTRCIFPGKCDADVQDMSDLSFPDNSTSTNAELALVVDCPLRKGNTRIYYVPEEQVGPVVEGLLHPAAPVQLAGTADPNGTANGGDYILLWLPDSVGYCGFLQIPEELGKVTAGQALQLKVCKAFAPVKSKTAEELRGLASNPSVFTAGFGKLVASMNDCGKAAKYQYNPDSVLAVLHDMWNQAESHGRFARTHAPRDLSRRRDRRHMPRSEQQQSGRKRKSRSETKQLNREILLKELVATGMTEQRAVEILDTASTGWGVEVMTGSDEQLSLIIQVYRPGHSTPVISAPFETVYKDVAKLWKQEFDTPKPKPSPKGSRYTRQQEKAAAALEAKLRTEGLNEVQQQQLREMIAEALKPIAEEQQQQKQAVAEVTGAHTALAATVAAQTNNLQQIMPALQQIATGFAWAQQQQQFSLPAAQVLPVARHPATSRLAPARQSAGPAALHNSQGSQSRSSAE